MALGDFDSRWKNPQGNTPELLYLWAQDLIKELRKGDYISSSIASGIANSELADMAAWTIKLRNSATAGDPQDVTINGLTEETSIDTAADFFMMWDASAGVMRKAKPNNFAPGMRLLTSGSASNAASLDVVLTSYTAYQTVMLVLNDVIPQTDDTQLLMRFSTNGGSSYDSGANDYQYATVAANSNLTGVSVGSATVGTSSISLSSATAANKLSSDAGAHAEFVITIFNRTNASRKTQIIYQGGYVNTTPITISLTGSGFRNAAQDTDAVTFLMSSGNINASYKLYGLD